MAPPRYRSDTSRRMRSRTKGKVIHVDFGGRQILDHSEATGLSLLLRRSPEITTFRVDISGVMSLPSGFFGALLDGVEMGRRMLLVNATPEVQALVGYKRFITRGVVHL